MSLRFRKKQSGATVVEYAMLVTFIAMAVLVTVFLLGEELDKRYQSFVECVKDETAAACK